MNVFKSWEDVRRVLFNIDADLFEDVKKDKAIVAKKNKKKTKKK
jgi:hypothetical protein